ncbi:MAG: hypothetical protein KAW93_05355, partial [Methanogenium sp.]|nr:hypothetical protein [Methanogenium sp.]
NCSEPKYCNIAYVIYTKLSFLLLNVVTKMGKRNLDKGYVSLVERTIDSQMTAELMDDDTGSVLDALLHWISLRCSFTH